MMTNESKGVGEMKIGKEMESKANKFIPVQN
jgi:hypothetical protein